MPFGHGNATSIDNPEGAGPNSVKPGERRAWMVKEENWDVRDEKALLMRIQGYSNPAIADALGVNPARVSQILNSPPAKKALRKLRERLREQAFQNLEDKLLKMGDEAIENIRQTVEYPLEDASPGSKAKKHQDDVSFKVLETLGYGKGSAKKETEGGVKMQSEDADRIREAIAKSDEATEMHEGEDGVFRSNGTGEDEADS